MNQSHPPTASLREVESEDSPRLLELARAAGVFRPSEIQALEEVLEEYFCRRPARHRALACEAEGAVRAFIYYAPAAMTEGGWYLYWIITEPAWQGRGLGTLLVRHMERELQRQGARLLLIETSTLPRYAATRRFYTRLGYERAAVLPHFYAPDDHLVVFAKRCECHPGTAYDSGRLV
jgi:ribosomal protein S18 acetylase RimI-like enzyme